MACRSLSSAWLLVALLATPAFGLDAAGEAPSREALEFFEKQVRPLLIEHCYECHSEKAEQLAGGLRLDLGAGLLRGGDSGPAAVPGAPDESLLVRAVRYHDPLLQMPPDGRLAQREIDVLVEWVRLGLPDPRGETVSVPVAGADAAGAREESWWSFQPVRHQRPQNEDDSGWAAGPIDRFVLARLSEAGMRPAPPADKRTWIRRATFDLTGLPPTPEEIQAFLDDGAPDAFARVVDRLLASAHYGERWGRHWLDVVRYADTSGCNGDFPVPEAFRYRNYVIDSFNQDKPYDRFVREQIAGDLLPANSDEERFEQTVATGYLAISRRFSSLGEEFHLTLDDAVDNLGKAFLGLSVSCARCHEHKFDPIPQEDYYALYGIFQSARFAFPGTEIYRHAQDLVPLVSQRRWQDELRPFLDKMRDLDTRIFRTYSEMAEQDTGSQKDKLRAEWKKMEAERDELIKKLPSFDRAYAVSEGEATNARVHIKGDPENLGPEVPRGFLQILGGQPVPRQESGSGRLQLAGWLTDSQNPLTARVIVNRIWQWHFGQGLVRTADDFGTRGSPPTHPELLDYLAGRLLASGWSIKSLHRDILLSSTYRMASVEHPQYAQRDPDNTLFWTFNRRRLDAEEIRDTMLVVGGSLDRSRGTRHPFPQEWEWRYSQHRPFVDDFPTRRRSVYVMQQRIRQQPYFDVFDGADTNAVTGQRKASTTPQQALFMMNSPFVHEQADLFAERLFGESQEPADWIRRAMWLALGRPASADEVVEGLDYLTRVTAQLRAAAVPGGARPRSAVASYLRVILSSSEFVTVD